MSFALEVRFLMERYAATAFNDRRRAEWPPHPARVYSALVAALHDGDPDEGEREALRWLASAPPPDVIASRMRPRTVMNVYVPTNDASALADIDRHILAVGEAEDAVVGQTGKALESARKDLSKRTEQLRRRSIESARDDGKGTPRNAAELLAPSRQARTFPVVRPDVPEVHLEWETAPPDEVVAALDRVAARVARLGHSSSLVSLRFVAGPIEVEGRTRWTPRPDGKIVARVPTGGQLERLEGLHEEHQAVSPRVLPARFEWYGEAAARPAGRPHGAFDDAAVVFEVVANPRTGSRQRVDVSLTQMIARAFRGAFIAASGGGLPEVLSGHDPSGERSTRPHLAFVPLADVGHANAPGTVLGVALIVPRDIAGPERRSFAEAIRALEAAGPGDRVVRLVMGRHGELDLCRLREEPAVRALEMRTWSRPSARWATATPVALDRNPGDLLSRRPEVVARAVTHAEETIANAAVQVGLPRPQQVFVHRRSLLVAAPEARRFGPFPSNGHGHGRVLVHAEIVFSEPVHGPVLLGAGRYLGVGLFRPLVRE